MKTEQFNNGNPTTVKTSGLPRSGEETDRSEADRFEDLAKKLVKVPKREIDERRQKT